MGLEVLGETLIRKININGSERFWDKIQKKSKCMGLKFLGEKTKKKISTLLGLKILELNYRYKDHVYKSEDTRK